METKNLESKILFRLVKTLYIVCLVVIFLFVLFLGWSEKPTPFIDGKKSTLVCENGKKYLLDDAKIYIFSKTESLEGDEDIDARRLCEYGVLDDYSSGYRNLKVPQHKNYSLNTIESISGSWFSVLVWWGIGFSASYILLNLLRETINYILFGKKFDWVWILVPIGILAMAFSSENNTENK